jgi:CRISPR-associated endonuclease Csn1
METYIKAVESFANKKEKNKNLVYDSRHDLVSSEKNLELYDRLTEKLGRKPYAKRPNNPVETLRKGRAAFTGLDAADQVDCLLQVLQVFGRMTSGCDLSMIGGSKHSAVTLISASLTNVSKYYTEVRIIDTSASGLHEMQSQNLLELL